MCAELSFLQNKMRDCFYLYFGWNYQSLLECGAFYEVEGPVFGFGEDFAEVFAYYA